MGTAYGNRTRLPVRRPSKRLSKRVTRVKESVRRGCKGDSWHQEYGFCDQPGDSESLAHICELEGRTLKESEAGGSQESISTVCSRPVLRYRSPEVEGGESRQKERGCCERKH
jgi:hypothetical protein